MSGEAETKGYELQGQGDAMFGLDKDLTGEAGHCLASEKQMQGWERIRRAEERS